MWFKVLLVDLPDCGAHKEFKKAGFKISRCNRFCYSDTAGKVTAQCIAAYQSTWLILLAQAWVSEGSDLTAAVVFMGNSRDALQMSLTSAAGRCSLGKRAS